MVPAVNLNRGHLRRKTLLLSIVLLLSLGLMVGSASRSAAAANPIVLENQQPGTDQWQLSRSGYQTANDASKQIKGYASATSVNKGEAITFYVSVNPAQSYTMDIYRIGWYQGLGGRFMQRIGPIGGSQQSACPINASTGLIECAWVPSYTFTVPTTWTSGIYFVLLTNSQNYQNYINFVIRDDSRVSDLLYQESVATFQAYNNYPNDGSGKSLYEYNSYGANTIAGTTRAVKVSFDRPYLKSGDGGLLTWEIYFVRWLERSGYDATYSTDIDTHANGERLLNHKAFLSVGHDEYWSKAMVDSAERARDLGVNLGFFGANGVSWQVRFEPATAAPNRVLVFYKEALDPVQGPTTTVRWRNPYLNRPEQRLIGIQSTAWLSPDIDQTVPYVVTNSSHWAYSGTGFRDGDSVPRVVGYETDRYMSEYPQPAYINSSYTLLSRSPVTNYSNNGAPDYSNSSIYQAPSGAWVFGAGTISWAWALDRAGMVDTRMQQTTANILNKFIVVSGTVPYAPSGFGATAVSASQINLTWTDNSTDETNFIVERALTSAFSSITSFTLPAGTTSSSDTGLAAGTTYYYRVKANNGAGSSPYSNVASATTQVASPPPASPPPASPPAVSWYLYDDQLRNNWANWSYSGTADFNSTSTPAFSGTKCISFQPTGSWAALQFGYSNGTFATTGYSSITFALKATQPNQKFGIFFNGGSSPFKKVSLDTYGSPPQGAWKVYTIPLSDLAASNTSVSDLEIQDWSGSTGPQFYVDQVSFSGN